MDAHNRHPATTLQDNHGHDPDTARLTPAFLIANPANEKKYTTGAFWPQFMSIGPSTAANTPRGVHTLWRPNGRKKRERTALPLPLQV